jgi:anti-sigma B factor antagonist
VTASSLDPPAASELVSLTVSGDGAEVVVSAAGEVDSTSAPVLRQRLEALLDDGARQLTVDLGGVTFLDSAGLCVLAATHRRALREDVRMRVLASSRAVIRPLQITGLWSLLQAEQIAPGEPLQEGAGAA